LPTDLELVRRVRVRPLPPFALLQRGFDDDEEEASLKGKVRWGRDSIAALGLKF